MNSAIFSKTDLSAIQQVKSIIRAADHKFRKQILEYLHEAEEKTVTDLFVHFRIDQSSMSQHLGILRKAGFVKTRRAGKAIFYSLDEKFLNKFKSSITF